MKVVVAPLADVAPSSVRRLVAADSTGATHAIAVVRIADSFYGIGDVCSHADVSLAGGTLWDDECELECPKHGSAFDLRTGHPATLPATQPVPVYAVSVDPATGNVVVELP